MYLTRLKTVLHEAVKQTFDAEWVNPDFRNLHVSLEFPIKAQNYPGIWVDYTPIGPLQIAGVDHREYAEPSPVSGTSRRITRWRYQGEASFTVAALSSFHRDRLHDEVVRMLAFGRENAASSEFREYIEDNEFLAVNFDFDEIVTRGFGSSVGTPWQTDDVIYEAEIAMECFGEFISDNQSATLLPFSSIDVTAYTDGQPDPTDQEGWITA